MEDWQHGGFGLYIHWPFCQSKCPYCDFNSHVSSEINQDRWARAYLTEIDRVGLLTQGRVLQTVFFGGGTPSLMDPRLVAAILDRVRATWPMVNNPEITLEANPGSVETGRFRAYRDAGVNRVSMGIQALNDSDLRRLGRLHSVADAQVAFSVARNTFDRVSFDLIYARQDQTMEQWKAELRAALSMAVDHLSLYQLTIEPGTAFGDRFAKGGLLGLPNEDVAADLYDVTQELCDAAGLQAYEVSNHAGAGSESRHNLIYWRGGDYLGIGPGAHGRLTLQGVRWATEALRMPTDWLLSVEAQGHGELAPCALTGEDRAQEYLLMGLRLTEGISLRRYRSISGQDLPQTSLSRLADLGLISVDRDRLAATRAGRMVLNGVLRELV
ncbi:MAG: radical SAM family heme chaperone HemW [Paracoccaceae bacterium]